MRHLVAVRRRKYRVQCKRLAERQPGFDWGTIDRGGFVIRVANISLRRRRSLRRTRALHYASPEKTCAVRNAHVRTRSHCALPCGLAFLSLLGSGLAVADPAKQR